MEILQKLQTALIDIRGEDGLTSRVDQHSFLRKRARKVTDTLISELDWQEIMSSLDKIPHQLSHIPTHHNDDKFVPFFFSYIENEFTQIVESVLTLNEKSIKLFIEDLDFAAEAFKSLSSGWTDACEKCGKQIHIKFDPTHNLLYQVKFPLDSSKLECDYEPSNLEHVIISSPSREIIISDSLNDFILLHNKQISAEYKSFVKNQLMTTSSTSVRGDDLLRAFYARFNMGYFHIGKGYLDLLKAEDNISLIRVDTSHNNEGDHFYDVSSRYLTIMDLGYFKTICQSKSLDYKQAMRSISAKTIQIDSEFTEINNYRTAENQVQLVFSELSQKSSIQSRESSLSKD